MIDNNKTLFENLISHYNSPNKHRLFYCGTAFTESGVLKEIYKVRSFLQQSGIGRGDAVSVVLPNMPETVFAIYGISANGGIINMLSPAISAEAFKESLVKTKTKFAFVWDCNYENLKSVLSELNILCVVCSLTHFAKEPFLTPLLMFDGVKDCPIKYSDLSAVSKEKYNYEKVDGNLPALYLTSAGRTNGTPHICVFSAKSVNIAAGKMDYRVFDESELSSEGTCVALTAYLCFALSFFYGMHLFLPRYKVCIVPLQIADKMPDIFNLYKVTFIVTAPIIVKRLLADKGSAEKALKYITQVHVGGGVCPQDIKDAYKSIKKGKFNLYESYAATKGITVPCVAIKEHTNSNGTPLDGIYRIKNLNGDNFLPAGEQGELYIEGDNLMLEYLGEGENTSAFAFFNGKKYLKTADIGYMDESGAFRFVCKKYEK
jgi:long-chain acyl-CoA synthetase